MGIHDELIGRMTPGLVADRVLIGAFVTVVQAGDRAGLSTTLRPATRPHSAPAVKEPGSLSGRPLSELAGLVFSKNPMESSLGMAAINAGLPLAGLELDPRNGADLLRERADHRNLAVIGHFHFIHELIPQTNSTVILELDPQEGDLPASQAERVIPQADVVAITGSAFSNRTIERLLEFARGKWVIVMGPTTPLSPLLFDYGVDAIAGSVVSDLDLTLRQAAQGAIFKQLEGARRVLLEKPRG